MVHLEAVLRRHGIADADVAKLAAFESRNGFSVLSKDEFDEMRKYFGDFPVYQFLVPLLTDNNSNYYCLYVDGPLKNMTCYLNHEELDLAPRFRSLASFLDAVADYPHRFGTDDFEARFFDFPSREVSPNYAQDQEIISVLYQMLAAATDDDQRTQTAFALMALASPADLEAVIYPFLDDEDMYVQERAIRLLGFHAYKPAAAKLKALTTNAHPNGRLAARIALQKIADSRGLNCH